MPKKEYAPKSIYVTNQPVVVMPLERLDEFYGILMDYDRRERMTIQERKQFDERVKVAISSTRKEVKAARQYFKIQSVRRINRACTPSTESK